MEEEVTTTSRKLRRGSIVWVWTFHKIDGLHIQAYLVVEFMVSLKVGFQKFCYQCSCLHVVYKNLVSVIYSCYICILHNTTDAISYSLHCSHYSSLYWTRLKSCVSYHTFRCCIICIYDKDVFLNIVAEWAGLCFLSASCRFHVVVRRPPTLSGFVLWNNRCQFQESYDTQKYNSAVGSLCFIHRAHAHLYCCTFDW